MELIEIAELVGAWPKRDGMPIPEIVRLTGLSRNTVRKYLTSQDLEPSYPARKSPSKLDDCKAGLPA